MQVNISDITDTVDSEGLDVGGDRPAGRAGSNGDRGSHHGGPAIPVHAIMFTLLSGTGIASNSFIVVVAICLFATVLHCCYTTKARFAAR